MRVSQQPGGGQRCRTTRSRQDVSPGASVPPSSRSDWPLWLWPPRGKVFLVSGRGRGRNGQGPAEATGCPPALIRDRERRPEGRGAVRLWPPPWPAWGIPSQSLQAWRPHQLCWSLSAVLNPKAAEVGAFSPLSESPVTPVQPLPEIPSQREAWGPGWSRGDQRRGRWTEAPP